jgi:putative hemolysin
VAQLLAQVPVLAPYSQALGLGLVVLIITYLSLVVGELVPKRLGLSNPEKIAILVASPLEQVIKNCFARCPSFESID